MASIAVLPILIGLAVDYAIQFQARYDEAVAPGAARADAARTRGVRGPTIATACLATAAGFLVLLLSPTPMVRGFGLLVDGGRRDRLRPRSDGGLGHADAASAGG